MTITHDGRARKRPDGETKGFRVHWPAVSRFRTDGGYGLGRRIRAPDQSIRAAAMVCGQPPRHWRRRRDERRPRARDPSARRDLANRAGDAEPRTTARGRHSPIEYRGRSSAARARIDDGCQIDAMAQAERRGRTRDDRAGRRHGVRRPTTTRAPSPVRERTVSCHFLRRLTSGNAPLVRAEPMR